MNILFLRRARGARWVALLALAVSSVSQATNLRTLVEMPAPMQEHTLANMRDHPAAVGEIQAALAKGKYSERRTSRSTVSA